MVMASGAPAGWQAPAKQPCGNSYVSLEGTGMVKKNLSEDFRLWNLQIPFRSCLPPEQSRNPGPVWEDFTIWGGRKCGRTVGTPVLESQPVLTGCLTLGRLTDLGVLSIKYPSIYII